MDTEQVYKMALAMTEGMTAPLAKAMDEAGISCRDFFTLPMEELSLRLSTPLRFEETARQEALFRARREEEFVQKHSIRVLGIFDDGYPVLLRETPDAPLALYVLGHADLNAPHMFSVVGTRRCTAYGTGFCRSFIAEMAAYFPDSTVVSGLAYGIDAASHTAALENKLPTIAVVAHGLNMVYPAAHRSLARTIIERGGAIVSEYPSGVKPFQRNFLERNRIVAGLSELTVVVESEVRGGAMSTANQAFSYSREVVAVPGRYSDITSSGCNLLISKQKAHLFTSTAGVAELLRWKLPAIGVELPQGARNLFPELQGDLAAVYEFLRKKGGTASADEIHQATQLPMPDLMGALTELEFDGIISRLPGSRYELC